MHVQIDGSNVMYWGGEPPTLDPVIGAIEVLMERGIVPHVVFDANVGHVVFKGSKRADELAQMLKIPAAQVSIVDKGSQADRHLLSAARAEGGQVVSNDLFRDWAKTFPEVRRKGHLIHGGYHKGKLWLDFDGSRPRAAKTRRRKSR
ncbi:MAG: hypothetical protein ABJN34_07315 [Litoreibacter sp.]|uniref:NYN domain-containing protein n=1 Tax=Litoreibacter sp. TaxID=1969459 RepID=UPI0032991E33